MKKIITAVLLLSAMHVVWGVKYFDLYVKSITFTPIVDGLLTQPQKQGIIDGINDELSVVEDPINEKLSVIPNLEYDTALRNFADASVMGGGGGLDYSTNIRAGMLGLNLGLAASAPGAPFSFNRFSANGWAIPGVSFTATGFLGFRLDKTKLLFINWANAEVDSNSALRVSVYGMDVYRGSGLGDYSINAEYSTIGFHIREKIVPSIAALNSVSPVKWNGVDLVYGLDSTKFKAVASLDLPSSVVNRSNVPFDSGVPGLSGENYSSTGSGRANLGVDIYTFSIPIEVVTSIRSGLIPFKQIPGSSIINSIFSFTMYAGLGMNLNRGSAGAIANSSLEVEADAYADASSLGLSSNEKLGDVSVGQSLNLGNKAKPHIADMRVLGGLTTNIGPAHLYLAGSANLFYSAYSVRIGTSVDF